MTGVNELLRSQLTYAVALVLLHSLWMDGLLFALLVLVLKRQSASPATRRYQTLLMFLALMIIAPVTAALCSQFTPVRHAASHIAVTITAVHGPVAAMIARLGSLLPLLAASWCVGQLILGIAAINGWVYISRILKAAVPVTGDTAVRLAALSAEQGLSRSPLVAWSHQVDTPMVIGGFLPSVLLPADMQWDLTAEQLDALMVHELAHIRRGDVPLNYLQSVVESLFFFNPVLRWTSRRLRDEREVCCDELVVKTCDRSVYIRALAALAERRSRQGWTALAAMDGRLLSRVKRLAGQVVPAVDHVMHAAMVSVLAGAAGFALLLPLTEPATMAHGQPLAGTVRMSSAHSAVGQVDVDTVNSQDDGPDAPGQPEDDTAPATKTGASR